MSGVHDAGGMADSPVRAAALHMIFEAQGANLGSLMGGAWQAKQAPMVAAALLDLADAVRELARKAK